MAISRLTAVLIINDPEVYAASYGPFNGKFGLYVGTMNYSPSGQPRPRDLVTSEAVYESAEEAKRAAELVIQTIRTMGKKEFDNFS